MSRLGVHSYIEWGTSDWPHLRGYLLQSFTIIRGIVGGSVEGLQTLGVQIEV
jgi:hypothetical protein